MTAYIANLKLEVAKLKADAKISRQRSLDRMTRAVTKYAGAARDKTELRLALEYICQVLGKPCKANKCEGCKVEMEMALDVARRAAKGKSTFLKDMDDKRIKEKSGIKGK